MSPRRIAILVSYFGPAFCGWQIQSEDDTVQGRIESALKTLHKKETPVTGSGRTDSGVHALGQVAHFDTESSIPPEKYTEALNSLLPKSIRILGSTEVDDRFHSRFSAVEREYEYRIIEEKHADASSSQRYHTLRTVPDIAALNRLASVFAGTHDFTAFAAAGDESESKVREIRSAAFFMRNGILVFRIRGNAFLWRMVRSITGTILQAEQKGLTGNHISDIIAGRRRESAGPTAPPYGLYLTRVSYEKTIF